MALTKQLISKNCGKIKPESIDGYIQSGGYEGLKKALTMQPKEIIAEVKAAKLLGRGGAAYPVGAKWEHLLEIPHSPKFIVCNADEGEPGTFKDKILLSQDPLRVIEGMTIAAHVFGSHDAYIYIRGEYLAIQKVFQQAIDNAIAEGYLGNRILGTDFTFNIHITSGAGAYVCGENSALLNSIEGKPGYPRIKPPHLAEVGLFSMPTLVNNVESFATIPTIVLDGGNQYANYGTADSGGTKLICLSGLVVNQGVYEIPFGITLRDIIYNPEIGGGIANGKKLKFFHLGGQSGPCGIPEQLDTPYCYAALRSAGLSVGSGAVVILDESVCVVDYLKGVTEFFIHESCGKCTPCREGNQKVYAILCKLSDGTATTQDFKLLKRLITTMTAASFCGLGQSATIALATCLKHFSAEIEDHLHKKCPAGVCFQEQERAAI
ncbi:MAG: hndC 1 [Firmicutes bacterium]|nr:hndC 1 [Bacillota bacterium]